MAAAAAPPGRRKEAQKGERDRVGSIGATRPMRHRAGHHTAHDKRREPIDPKFRHGADGVADKSAEITDVRARDRNHGGQCPRGNEPRSTVQTCWTRRHPITFLEGRYRKRLREWELVEEGVD